MRPARLSQVHSRTSSRARAARRDASAASPSTRDRPAASAPALAGLDQDRVLLRPQDLAQRGQVRRDHRPPRRHVLEQLQRRRVGGRHAARCVRQHQHVGLPQQSRDPRRVHLPGERHASRRHAGGQRADALEIRLARQSADDERVHTRQALDGLDEHVGPLPRVQMPSVSHDGAARRGRLPQPDIFHGRHARAIGHDRQAGAGAETPFEFAGQRRRDGDVPAGASPHQALPGLEAPALRRRQAPGRREHVREVFPHRRREAVRLVDHRRPRGGRQAGEQAGDGEVSREEDVSARAAERPPHAVRHVGGPPRGQRGRHPHALDRERADRCEPVVGQRVPRRRGAVGADHQVHLVAPARQRVAGLHRLHAVGAIERKPDVGEVPDAQEATPRGYDGPPGGAGR